MAKAKVQIPTIGRIIHVEVAVHEAYHREVVTRPAMIVRAWENADEEPAVTHVSAQVFMDGDGGPSNDGTPNLIWKQDLKFDESDNPGENTWHWPTRD